MYLRFMNVNIHKLFTKVLILLQRSFILEACEAMLYRGRDKVRKGNRVCGE